MLRTNTYLARMHWLTLRFADEGLERAFVDDQAHKVLTPFRIAMILAAAVSAGIWAVLGHIFPQIPHGQSRFALPIMLIVAVVLLGYAWSYHSSFNYHQQEINLAGLLRSARL